MPYNGGVNLDPALLAEERQMLLAGVNYTQLAEHFGCARTTVRERNRRIHKINIWEAFERKVGREGIPNRLTAPAAFGYWFSGFFDGEGNIMVYHRQRSDRYAEYRLTIRIALRDDDAGVIARIHDNLQVGHISHHGRRGSTNPSIAWACEDVTDLAEVIVPLFDRYPLYTKKADEYAIWRPLVVTRYIDTMGGYSNRNRIPEEHRTAFMQGVEAVRKIHAYA